MLEIINVIQECGKPDAKSSGFPHEHNVCFSLIRDNHTQISHIAGDLSVNTSPWNKDCIIGQKRPGYLAKTFNIPTNLIYLNAINTTNV